MMEELSEIVQSIQSEETGLDDLSNSILKANDLIKKCKEKLRSVEEQIEEVMDDED